MKIEYGGGGGRWFGKQKHNIFFSWWWHMALLALIPKEKAQKPWKKLSNSLLSFVSPSKHLFPLSTHFPPKPACIPINSSIFSFKKKVFSKK